MLSKRVKTFIAELLIVVGFASAVVSSLSIPVATCHTSIQQSVPQCTPSYGSLILFETMSGAILLGGVYLIVTVRKSGSVAPVASIVNDLFEGGALEKIVLRELSTSSFPSPLMSP